MESCANRIALCMWLLALCFIVVFQDVTVNILISMDTVNREALSAADGVMTNLWEEPLALWESVWTGGKDYVMDSWDVSRDNTTELIKWFDKQNVLSQRVQQFFNSLSVFLHKGILILNSCHQPNQPVTRCITAK